MGAFTIEIVEGTKVYKDAERRLKVWRYESCVEKLRKAKVNDPHLEKAFAKLEEMQAKYTDDLMGHRWYDDCVAVWMKAHAQVLSEGQPPQDTTEEDKNKAIDELFETQEEKPKPKLSVFSKKKTSIFGRNKN